MSGAKRVLIVDDNYETVEYLENALQLIEGDIKTLGVPSGEEAWLEILQHQIDLMLVDLRLPGMSGSDLIQRVQKRYPDLPVMVMSGFAMEMMKRETSGLTVHRFLEKPMDTDQLLKTVEIALFGKPQRSPEKASTEVPSDVKQQLDRLRIDTGAEDLLLATLSGQMAYQTGNESDLEEAGLLERIGQSIQSGLTIADQLKANSVRAIQYLSTEKHEFYFANVGRGYFLALAYDAQNQRARIGTVWVFLQRVLRELQDQLPEPELPDVVETQAELAPAEPVSRTKPAVAPAKTEVAPEPIKEEPKYEEVVSDPMSFEEAMAQGLVPSLFGQGDEEADDELDLFGDVEGAAEEDLAVLMDLAASDQSEEPELDLFGDVEDTADDDLAILMDLAGSDAAAAPADEDLELDLLALDALGDEENMGDDDLDAFWDAAAADSEDDKSGDMSWDEALESGMINEDGA